jgi:hypothetical protein
LPDLHSRNLDRETSEVIPGAPAAATVVTTRVAGVVPNVGETVSQGPPETLTVNGAGTPAERKILCGLGHPIW